MAKVAENVANLRRSPKGIRFRDLCSEEDNEYVGLCVGFPSLSWLAPTQQEALEGIRQLVANVVMDMEADEEAVPEPIALRRHSGTPTVRIPHDLHRRLALEAAESAISLKRLASAKLSQ